MDGLLVDGRGGDSAGGEDAVDGFLRNGLRGEGAAGVAGVEEMREIHGIGFCNLSHSRPDLDSFS